MNRTKSIAVLNNQEEWDVIIIGGGATGLGIALDATLRGYKTLLLEQSDFTKGTSSKSTKLVHGGVRYLAQGNVKLVLEALHERGLLLKNAPHVCNNQEFIIPCYHSFDTIKFWLGLKLYDVLAGLLSLGKSTFINSKKLLSQMPSLAKENLKGGIVYYDGQFDDARLGINIAQTAVENNAHLINYIKVIHLSKNETGKINQVTALDTETGNKYCLNTKVVINATGVYVDSILNLDDIHAKPLIKVSQGTHIVLDKSYFPTEKALMIPKTSDGRVLFIIPWHDKLVVGTTDIVVESPSLEPIALDDEIEFILHTFNKYSKKIANKSAILSKFSGLRPLAKPTNNEQKTKEISRSHKIMIAKSGLISILGGKWTTYRRMAEDTVNAAIKTGNLRSKKSLTATFQIHGYCISENNQNDHLAIYGSDAAKIRALINDNATLGEKLHTNYPYLKAEVVWAVRFEMALKVEDFLSRRIRILFLDAEAAIEMSTKVAEIMAKELDKDSIWINEQLNSFKTLANGYLIK